MKRKIQGKNLKKQTTGTFLVVQEMVMTSPGSPVVMTSPSSASGESSIPGR